MGQCHKSASRSTHKLAAQQSEIKENDAFMLLEWREHCHECAPPVCYTTCSNYLERADKKCHLFQNGIAPIVADAQKTGPFAHIIFRKWAKLEAKVTGVFEPVSTINRYTKANLGIGKTLNALYTFTPLVLDKKRKLNGAFTHVKGKFLPPQKGQYSKSNDFSFVLSCYSFSDRDFNLILESGYFRHNFLIKQGYNAYDISLNDSIDAFGELIKIYPENDYNADVLFGLCDIQSKPSSFVQPTFKDGFISKAVIWDLDNTLWEGVFVEDGASGITVREDIVSSIIKLDALGVVNSIISKNDYENVLPILEKHGLAEYFVFPKVNWQSKSANFAELIADLNFNPDTMIFIDDNPFERAEVASVYPQINCFDQFAFPRLLDNAVFSTLKPNKESQKRRLSYKQEEKRKNLQVHFSDKFLDFLKSCDINVEISSIQTDIELARAKELLQRTNQLNLSGKRFSDADFDNHLNQEGLVHWVFKVYDKFGSYGIVGYFNLDTTLAQKMNCDLCISNLVISCRVAQKKIENALIEALISTIYKDSVKTILATYQKTERNTPILLAFEDMGFKQHPDGLFLDTADFQPVSDIISIHVSSF